VVTSAPHGLMFLYMCLYICVTYWLSASHRIAGLAIVTGGYFFQWNIGLQAGFGNFVVAYAFTSIGYICLCFSLAEMTSILPFSGGGYGFARVTVNIYGGYIVGSSEAIEYLLYVATSVYVMGKMLSILFNLPSTYEPIYWFVFYVGAIGIQLQGGILFWRINTILACMSVLLICLYCLACIPAMDFNENAKLEDGENAWFGGHEGISFMHVLPLTSWFFIGVEAMSLAGQETLEVSECDAAI
jgi:ethanolamine permease